MDVLRARVVELLKGRDAAQLAKGVGRSPTWISRFLNGKRDVPFDTAEKIAAFLGVPLWQLLLDEAELRSMASRETAATGFRTLPWLATPIAAGKALTIEPDPDRDRELAFSERFVLEHPGAVCLTVGRGQLSMAPTILPGDVVVIDRNPDLCRTPRQGQIYAVNFYPLTREAGGAVKRVELRDGHLVISSDNADKREFPTQVFDVDGLNLLDVLKGLVVWFGRNLGEKKGRSA